MVESDEPDGRAARESTASLLDLVRDGDKSARERLVRRYLPALHRWARGRLPRYARDLSDTDDLVQVCFTKALAHVREFQPQKDGAFLAYLRRILLNQIRDEIRRVSRRPRSEELPDEVLDESPSPLEEAIGREKLEAYEAALATLPERQQEAVILRLELGFTHGEVAEALGFRSPDAARMAVARGLARLSEVMDGE